MTNSKIDITSETVYVINSSGDDVGIMTGSTRYCKARGCNGKCYAVKWVSDGTMTWPCNYGLRLITEKLYKIRY
jgi:hypothetical protein